MLEGGLGRHVHQLSAALSRDGHDVHVLCRGRDDLPEVELTADAVTVHRVPIEPFAGPIATFLPWVADLNDRLIERGREVLAGTAVDLVHSHDWLVAAAGEALAAQADVPWLVTVHATEFGRHNGWVHTHPQRAIHLTERAMVRRADGVIACSAYMAGHVERVFGLETGAVTAIPNGIALDGLSEAGAPSPVRTPLVLMVGRLVYEKGFHVALEALAELAADGAAFLWAIAGTGTAEADLHAQVRRLGLQHRGRFLGRVDDDTLHDLYRSAAVCVVPSLYEPFGIVPLEAMACGAPVIVSATGGLREVTAGADAARQVPPGDVHALAQALGSLLGDPGRRAAMGAAARAHAARFDWQVVSETTAGVYAASTAVRPTEAV